MSIPVVIEKQISAQPADVFQALTSPQRLGQWWWPHIADTQYEVDAKVGGAFRIASRAAGIGTAGEFLTLDPPERIVMTWNWENDGVSEVSEIVRVRLELNQMGTLVSVTHEVDEVAGDAEAQRQGWESVLGRLAELFA